jgi:hypothetical protein
MNVMVVLWFGRETTLITGDGISTRLWKLRNGLITRNAKREGDINHDNRGRGGDDGGIGGGGGDPGVVGIGSVNAVNNQQRTEAMNALKVKDGNGQAVKGWSFGTFEATQVGVGKARRIKGWCLRSHDGVERYSEGNWQQFVPFAQLVIGNYGFKSDLS